MTVADKIELIKLEENIFKAINLCELDLFDTLELEELTDAYELVETDIQYASFDAYKYDGKIVFVKALNDENGFGKLVIVPHEVTDEEYEIVLKSLNKPTNKLATTLTVMGFVGLFLVVFSFVVTIISAISTSSISLDSLLYVIVSAYLSPTLLSLIAMGIAKRIKK